MSGAQRLSKTIDLSSKFGGLVLELLDLGCIGFGLVEDGLRNDARALERAPAALSSREGAVALGVRRRQLRLGLRKLREIADGERSAKE